MIPAKYYYDDATQDQWQQKKKSKKELQQNKKAKLDPNSRSEADDYSNSHASAKDVMENKASVAKKIVLPGRRKVEEANGSVSEPVQESESEKSVDLEHSESEHESKDSDSDDSNLINTQIYDDDGNEKETFKKQALNKPLLSQEEQKKKDENLAKLREKLTTKINSFREKRKAHGTKIPGAPKSREQILEERKRKEEIKKEEKLKRKAAALEELDSELDSEDEKAPEEEEEDGVLFGNIVFNDGSRVTSDLSKLRNTAERRKTKGPANNDIKAHLQKLEVKKQQLAQMTPEEQEAQKSKDKWQRVLAQAEGVKVKDDEKLLKKALKRKERQKLKSEIEWKDRKQVVKDTVAARSKRREENLQSRRDNKGKKSKNQPRLKKFTGTINKKAAGSKKRAGFEGSAKSKSKK